ncbi:hypothetical protein CFP71_36610 [Amycolatopsis thailandensis]|uniref:Uncharacterized protein n=1 Tax=Amycolatopsis thailandensis TaxID=589330 RepID=A0A229RJW3_9PSEU|nr:hypothetical protein [Amycolatopsis thailandensis]OXM46749.1 hypothetical protein CFP71_36610 [Amycolatopsis thailandensis]
MNEQGPESDAPPMPAAVLPTEAELRVAAEQSTVLKDLRRYVAALGKPDEPDNALIPRWAEACGLVRVVDGAHVAVEENANLLDSPVELWERAYLTIGETGHVFAVEDDDVPPGFDLMLPRLVSTIAFTLYGSGPTPVPVDLLPEVLTAMLGLERSESTRHAVAVTLDLLERLGALHQGVADPAELASVTKVTGDPSPSPAMIWLTPIAVWAINRELRAAGVNAPVVGESADESLDSLCSGLVGSAAAIMDAELKAWARRRSPSATIEEASEFLRTTKRPEGRLFALVVLGATGEPGVEAAAEVRAEGGVPGAVAAMWLSEQGAVRRETITRDEVAIGMTDHFAAMHVLGSFVHQLADLEDGFDVVDLLTSSGHPATRELLDVVGAKHPDRAMAKKARTASFKLRSSGR